MIHRFLKFLTEGFVVTAGLNDAPLGVDLTGAGLSTVLEANPWLRLGTNTLTILLTAPPEKPGAEKKDPYTRAVVYTEDPDDPTNENHLVLARFERGATDVLPLPVVRAIPFEVPDPPPCLLWKEADVVDELSDRDQGALKALIREFENAILARDVDRIDALLDYKSIDVALANNLHPPAMKQTIRRQYQEMMFSQRDLRIEARDTPDLVMKLICQKQVVWISRHLTDPAMTVDAPDREFKIPVYAARFKGAWCIVR